MPDRGRRLTNYLQWGVSTRRWARLFKALHYHVWGQNRFGHWGWVRGGRLDLPY